jgi:hypothetical protein
MQSTLKQTEPDAECERQRECDDSSDEGVAKVALQRRELACPNSFRAEPLRSAFCPSYRWLSGSLVKERDCAGAEVVEAAANDKLARLFPL